MTILLKIANFDTANNRGVRVSRNGSPLFEITAERTEEVYIWKGAALVIEEFDMKELYHAAEEQPDEGS